MKSKIKFKSLSSGSCGNCYFLAIEEEDGTLIPILIDAGVSPRRLKKELLSEGIDSSTIMGILVTHDHNDHIRSLGSYCKHLKKPVWTTGTLHNALARYYLTKDHILPVRKEMAEGWNEIVPGRIKARYFEVPHDATQTVGYAIMLDDYKFVIMTDLGRITKEAMDFARQADTVVIEANYDLEMLRTGPYPVDLQDRICMGHGHLSNLECGEAIREFAHDAMNYIFLCHLSEHNNTPALALEAAKKGYSEALETGERLSEDKIRIIALPRESASPLFSLNLQP